MITEATSVEELAFVDKPVVVCFTNPLTCAPCKMLAPHYAKVAESMSDRVNFFEVNVLDHMDIAAQYGVMGTPTLVFITNERNVVLNARTGPPLLAEIEALLA